MCHSLGFRQHVFKVKAQENLTYSETSRRFRISRATLYRWKERLEPKTTRNCSPRKLDDESLRQHVRDYPDMYQYERAKIFGVQPRSIGRALTRLGITRKKNQSTSKSRRSHAYSPRQKNKTL